MVAMGETEITKVYLGVDSLNITEHNKENITTNNDKMPHRMLSHQFSKDTMDLRDGTENHNVPLKSCILISKEDGSGDRISVKKAKSVHFADSLGKPLKSVRTLVDPSDDAFELGILRLRSSTRRSMPVNIFDQREQRKENLKDECELLNFKQPGETKEFREIVYTQNVCLQNIYFREFGIFGTIFVKNICYKKEVSVVYTIDNWNSQNKLDANYVSGSSIENADIFSFKIMPKLDDDTTEIVITFAICYKANEKTYWDSNFGKNYSVLFRHRSKRKNDKSLPYDNRNGFILQKQPFVGWSM